MHDKMLMNIEELEQETSVPGKITAIIATCQAPIKTLLWSIFSLLYRSDPSVLEHIIVSINGPDIRTGDPSLQDEKQKCLELLRGCKWYGREMPLTIQRTWSRIGHTQAMEAAIPWVHTEHYLIMHDDVLVVNPAWTDDFKLFANNPNAAIMYDPPLLLSGVYKKMHNGVWKLALPHLNSDFLVCKKPILNSLGVRWWGYHLENKKIAATEDFVNWHMENGHMLDVESDKFHPNTAKLHRSSKEDVLNTDFNAFNMDIGSWVYYKVVDSGYSFTPLTKGYVYHFTSGSWNDNTFNKGVKNGTHLIDDLEKTIEYNQQIVPNSWHVYRKYICKNSL